jgi:hypothetical protein
MRKTLNEKLIEKIKVLDSEVLKNDNVPMRIKSIIKSGENMPLERWSTSALRCAIKTMSGVIEIADKKLYTEEEMI